MAQTRRGPMSIEEHRAWTALHGDWEPQWPRPDRERTDRIMARLSKAFDQSEHEIIEPLMARAAYTSVERADVEQTIREAIAVVTRTAWRAARDGRPLSDNVLFDAIARRWSPAYGKAIETTPARRASEMLAETIEAARHDVGCAGIRLGRLFALARRSVRGWYRTV